MDMADPEWQDREGVGEREIERERERGVEHGGAGEGDLLGNLVC